MRRSSSDHVALGKDDRIGEDEAAHPVGLECHHGAQMLLGDALVIGRVSHRR